MTMSAYVSTGGAPVPMAKNSNIMMLFVFSSLSDLISHTANPLKGDNSGPKFIDAIWETIARTAHEH